MMRCDDGSRDGEHGVEAAKQLEDEPPHAASCKEIPHWIAMFELDGELDEGLVKL